MSKIIENTAQQVLEIVPAVMRTIRAEFRSQRSRDLSIAQFRTLAYIKNNDGASLSSLAAHIGLTLPSMSKLTDGLVERGLVTRSSDREDRRKICLCLTGTGKSELEAAYQHTQTFLVNKISGLPKADLDTVSRSMQILKNLFISDHSENSALKTKK
jgi:DNA-binding MarR family transcriptional regulator